MRDQDLDTCKAVLIFLVVFGHFVERMIGWSNPQSHVLLGVIYAIHMPAFIFISGMLYKDKNYLKNIIFFIALFIPFQILYPLFEMLWTGKFQWNWNIIERPYWILWYLMGMMCWTLLTHFLIKTKSPSIIAIVLALFVGFSPWNNYDYSVGRILVFLPFFVLGHLYGQQLFLKVKQQKYAAIYAIGVLACIAVVLDMAQLSQFWLYGSLSYQQLKVGMLDGTLIRMGCLLMASLGIYSIFAFSTLFKGRFINLGVNTLPVYLLHGFVVIFISRHFPWAGHWLIELLICVALSVLTCWILQQRVFDIGLRKMSLWLTKPTSSLWK